MLEWTYTGINFSAKSTEPWADDGGIECAAHSSLRQRLVETLLTVIVAACEIYYATYYAKSDLGRSFPREYARERQGRPSVLRRLVLVVYALLWGIEIGFKLASRSFIYILNPCHMVTLIQIILLTFSSNYYTRGLYRLHAGMLNGGTLAIYFPVTATRLFPFEVELYYIQHILILTVPIFLLTSHGGYSLEPVGSFRWTISSIAAFRIYHHFVLQPVSLLTWVNLNGVLCPFQFDPFIGRYYRLWAHVHQTLFMIIHHKLFSVVARTCLQIDIRRIMYYIQRQESNHQQTVHSDIPKDK